MYLYFYSASNVMSVAPRAWTLEDVEAQTDTLQVCHGLVHTGNQN